MRIRLERPADVAAVRAINEAAFGAGQEANLVDALREREKAHLSLVAERNGSILGHILFSPVTLLGHADVKIMGLAPMAVSPTEQRQGIGSALVSGGLDRCKQRGVDAVVVLGHPTYYPRFGFTPASRFAIRSEYDVRDDVFMALELERGVLHGKSGVIRYHAAFADL
jgi:putative acetyltransferase